MIAMIDIFAYIVMILVFISAIMAITTTRLVDSVLFLSFVGIGSTVLFALMKAPDVALTEAAVGTGIVSLVFLSTLRRTAEKEDSDER